AGYVEYVNTKCQISGDIRDKRAVERMAAGYLKLLYPHLQLTDHELFEYCIEPAELIIKVVEIDDAGIEKGVSFQ
ncbi:MAG: BREX system Lon protease-like protein BrxL, partial [Dehalococcoidales bacterium]